MKEKLDGKKLQLYACCCSTMCGIGTNTFLPGYEPYAFVLNLIGIGGITFYICTRSKFDRVFRNLKLGIGDYSFPMLISKVKHEESITYKFTLPTGLSVEDIKKRQDAIEQHIGNKINVGYINKGLFAIEEYIQNSIPFFNYELTKLKGNVPILIGKNRKGKMQSFDLAEGTEPHLLIAGNTGCGKSTALRSIITNLILTTNVNLHLIDLKHGAEFSLFKRSSHVKSFACTLNEAETVLKNINDEIERRYALFADNELNDIRIYNKKFKKNPLPYELLIIDEMIDFQAKKELFFQLEVISAKSRSCGIHAIYSTQRPDKDVLNGRIKSNVTNVLGLKTKDGINSRIIIDMEGLEKLNGKGNGLLSRLGNISEIQTPYLDVDKTKELIKHTYIVKNKQEKPKEDKNITVDITDLAVFKE